jgi:hypothetical protein
MDIRSLELPNVELSLQVVFSLLSGRQRKLIKSVVSLLRSRKQGVSIFQMDKCFALKLSVYAGFRFIQSSI